MYEKLYLEGLLSWDCVDILYQDSGIFRTFYKLLNNLTLDSLGEFFEEITRNIKYIQDILLIFPYSFFKITNFSLLNEILSIIIKNTAIKKINLKIKIKEREFHFKYTEKDSDIISIILDLNLNNQNELIITKETKIYLHSISTKKSIPFKKLDANINLNIYILLFIENVLNSERVDQTNYKFFSLEIIKKTKNYKEPDKINIFNCHTLLKEINNSNNLVVNIWSILYLIRDSNSYLNKFLIKLENDIFSLFLYFENEILKEDSKTFANKVDIIINIYKDLKNILENDTFLVNLLKNENYTKDMNKDSNSIDERKRILNDLKNEKNKIDSFLKNKNIQNFPKIRKLFNKYMEILNNDINRIEEEIKTLEIQDYKERIEKTVKSEFEPKLGESLLKNMEIKNTIEELKEFEKLINNYKIKYIDENEEKINIFSNIVLSDNILEEVYKNKYVNLIEILLKYSKLKDKIEEITNNKKNKLVSLQELNKNTDLIYYDFFNSFLLSKEINENDINTVNQFLDAKYFWEIIFKDLTQNLIELKPLLNNLYNIENYEKINEKWCQIIGEKYNLSSNIYIPKMKVKTFLNLFIKKKDSGMEYERGFLLDINIPHQNHDLFSQINNVFEDIRENYGVLIYKKEKKDLIIELGNILIKHLYKNEIGETNELEALCKNISTFLEKEKDLEKEDVNLKIKIDILKSYIRAKDLYLNYNSDEELIFDDIYDEHNNKTFFTNKHPSLLNYIICNNKIYKNLLPIIINYNKPDDKNSIPLWLICLRTLANPKNIKPLFKYKSDDITIKFQKEFKEKISQKMDKKFEDVDWILLIAPNDNKFIYNENYERLYEYFNSLLYKVDLLNSEFQTELYDIIKKFIFDLFDDAYDKGVNYILTSKIQLFEINKNIYKKIDEYKNKEFNKINTSINITNLKSILSLLLDDNNNASLKNYINNLKTDLKTFEDKYNIERKNSKVLKSYSKLKDKCDDFNNKIDLYKNSARSKEEIENLFEIRNNEIEKYIKRNDANLLTLNIVFKDYPLIQKVKYIEKDQFIRKYFSSIPDKKINYLNNISVEDIDNQFKPLMEQLKEIDNIIKSLNMQNINELNKLKPKIKILKEKSDLLVINQNLNKVILEEINQNDNINIDNLVKSFKNELDSIIKFIECILNDFNKYQNNNNIKNSEFMEKVSEIYIPDEEILNSIRNNQKEFLKIIDEKNIIPYYIMQNSKIIGSDEIIYDFGKLNLNDFQFQNVYFASFDENIKYEIIKKNDDVKIIQRNKLFIINVKIKDKKEEKIENIRTEGIVKLYLNEKYKMINYKINYQLEAIKVYIKCDKYKLKYLGKTKFALNTNILFKDEEINFIIKNLNLNSEDFQNNFKVNLITYKNNNCPKPIKKRNREGFSLTIKTKSMNEKMSCLLNIYICPRFKIQISIYSEVKPFDFDFLISQNKDEGFLNKKIYCPFDEQDKFDFILYVGIPQKRLSELNFKTDYNKEIIKMTEIKETTFLQSKEINISVQLLKKEQSSLKLEAKVNEVKKEIEIIFTTKDKCNNLDYKFINNINTKEDNSGFFAYSVNEITAHGMKIEEKPNIVDENKRENKVGFINLNHTNNIQALNIAPINIKPNISINGINGFYHMISQEARILPIYYLNYKNEDSSSENQKLIKKNYCILEEIYNDLTHNNKRSLNFYEDNYFYQGIKEFASSFEYMKSVIEIKDKDLEKILGKLKDYILKNKSWDAKKLKWFEENIKKFKRSKKIEEYIKDIISNKNEEKPSIQEKNNSADKNEEIPPKSNKRESQLNKIKDDDNKNIDNKINNEIKESNNTNIKNIQKDDKNNNEEINNKKNVIENDDNNNKNIINNIKTNEINKNDEKEEEKALVEEKKDDNNNKLYIQNDIEKKEERVKEKSEIKENIIIEKKNQEENDEIDDIDEYFNNSGEDDNDEDNENNNNNINTKSNSLNSLLNMLKNENENQDIREEIPKSITDKKESFLEQDIWKENENKNEIYNYVEIKEENNEEYLFNEDEQFSSKIFNQEKNLNSLEDISKESNDVDSNPINDHDPSTKNKKKGIISPFPNIGKHNYIGSKNDSNQGKHEFENLLNKNNNNNNNSNKNNSNDNNNNKNNDNKNDSKIISQLLANDDKNLLIKKEGEKIFENKAHIHYFDDKSNINKYDEQLINTIITNIKENEEKKDKNNFSLKTEKPKFKKTLKDYIEKGNKNYIIKNFISFAKYFIETYLEKLTKSNLNFHDISFCFIIDCSQYLIPEMKLFNLLMILSIIKILYIVDIQFSIFLTADDNFKVILKDYDDDFIDYEDLIEILYETIIIERFMNNILKTLKTAIDYLKNKNRNTLYIGFFDYMDESFTYQNYWIENILNDKTNSFLLILEKSKLYKKNEGKNKKIIDKMMESFKEKINSNKKIKIIDINFDDLEKKFSNILSKFINDIIELGASITNINSSRNAYTNENKVRNNLKMKEFSYFEKIIKNNCYENYDTIYFKDNSRKKSNLGKLEEEKDEDGNEIMLPKIDEIVEFPKDNFFKILKNSSQDKTLIESIFYPNKATQKILSSKGTEIDYMALIKYALRPVQEPMIYLEYKGGLIRDYTISIIIDNSKSCFSEINENHSFLTLFNLLQIVNLMAFPSMDLILTSNGEPDILLYDKPSITIFKNYSIFEKMLKLLCYPLLNTDLSKAIQAIYNLKKKNRNMKDTYLFILTDGFSYKENEQKINNYLDLCLKIGIKINIIGLGIFPYRATEFLDILIYSANPDNLLRAISKIFGKIIKTDNEIKLISDSKINQNLMEILEQLKENKNFCFKKLIKELQDIEKGDDIFVFGNKEKDIYENIKFVEKGENLEIYSPDLLKTQEILMVMLWTCDINKKDSKKISPKYIDEPTEKNGGVSIKSSIEVLGIKNKIVVDYKSAIDELLKKNKKGECNYYAVWVFCGLQSAILPPINGEKNPTSPYLVEEFINVLIEFWTNGGALVFMADGYPLCFQVNLFLEKIDFSKDEKPKFHISGEYKGNQYLTRDNEGKLDTIGKFNKSEHKINYNGKEIRRQSLSHNIGQIYEGDSISYAVDENDKKITFKDYKKLLPFKPFSINSGGGISTLIYEADSLGRGDIIIDCGYTKCFFNMYQSGTFRFIQNIAGWTARPEIKFFAENINPRDWRPKGIKYEVKEEAKYDGFLEFRNMEDEISNMRTLFCIDDSGSTLFDSFYFDEIKDIIKKYYKENRGDIFYFWNEKKTKASYEEVQLKIEKRLGDGGTKPYLIAEIIDEEKQNEFKHLIIITDGNVYANDIQLADNIMKNINYKFDFVTVYILGEDADLSVGAPFCRKTPNKTMAKKKKIDLYEEKITLSKEDIRTLNNIENYYDYNEFKNNYGKIFNAVQAQCIGTFDYQLKEKLENMFENILNNNNNIDKEFIEKCRKELIGMTEGSIKNCFTLDQIKAAAYNL